MEIKKPPEWLPCGWIMEVKVRTRGLTAGFKDKYYIEPETGVKFRSKKEISRHVKAKELESRVPKPKKGCIDGIQSTEDEFHLHVQKKGLPYTLPKGSDSLPEGWITEIRPRKQVSSAIIKNDKYYIEPVTGSRFRSKNEVFRYLEAKKLRSNTSKWKKRCTNNICSTPLGVEENQNEKHKLTRTARRRLFQSPSLDPDGKSEYKERESHLEMPNSDGKSESEIKVSSSEILNSGGKSGSKMKELPLEILSFDRESESKIRELPLEIPKDPPNACERAGESSNTNGLARLKAGPLDEAQQENLQAKDRVSSARRKPKSRRVKKRPRPQSEHNAKRPRIGTARGVSRKLEAKTTPSWSRGTSMRLTRHQIEPPAELPPECDSKGLIEVSPPEKLPEKFPGNPLAELPPECNSKDSIMESPQEKLPEQSPRKPPAELPMGCDSKGLIEESPPEKLPGQSPAELPLNCDSKGSIEDLPLENLPELMPAKPNSPAMSVLEDMTDPCLEFAIKTLTGEIPVEDDNPVIRDYFREQLGSTGTESLTNLALPASSSGQA